MLLHREGIKVSEKVVHYWTNYQTKTQTEI